jgi:hypothetical protein
VERVLREALGSYNKRRLLARQFTRSSVAEACTRARALDQSPNWSIPTGCSAQVYRLLDAIVAGAAPHQLPAEFRSLAG